MPQAPESLTREDAGMLSGQLARRLVLGPGQRLVEDQGSGGDKGMVELSAEVAETLETN